MLLGQHILASGITGIVFAKLTNSWPGTIACFLSGILIDLDHLLDYVINKKKMCWSVKKLENFCAQKEDGKIYFFLHSYELVAFLWLIVFCFKLNAIWLGIVFGMSIHLLIDQLANPIYPLTYFLFYRFKLGFPKSLFLNFDRNLAKTQK